MAREADPQIPRAAGAAPLIPKAADAKPSGDSRRDLLAALEAIAVVGEPIPQAMRAIAVVRAEAVDDHARNIETYAKHAPLEAVRIRREGPLCRVSRGPASVWAMTTARASALVEWAERARKDVQAGGADAIASKANAGPSLRALGRAANKALGAIEPERLDRNPHAMPKPIVALAADLAELIEGVVDLADELREVVEAWDGDAPNRSAAKGYTQAELCAEGGISESSFRRIRDGAGVAAPPSGGGGGHYHFTPAEIRHIIDVASKRGKQSKTAAKKWTALLDP